MDFGVILSEIIDILVDGITGMASGIGRGLSALVSEIFLVTSEAGEVTGLSIFGGIVIVFAGRHIMPDVSVRSA